MKVMAQSVFYGRGILRDPQASWVERILSLLFRREEIPSRSNPDALYMRRFFLVATPRFLRGVLIFLGLKVLIKKLNLHVFYRSDEDPDCHDHPADFRTFVARGGYVDEQWIIIWHGNQYHARCKGGRQAIMVAGAYGFRRAEHCHRVRLIDPSKRTWTLVLFSAKRKDWYFYTDKGPVYWEDYKGPDEVAA